MPQTGYIICLRPILGWPNQACLMAKPSQVMETCFAVFIVEPDEVGVPTAFEQSKYIRKRCRPAGAVFSLRNLLAQEVPRRSALHGLLIKASPVLEHHSYMIPA